MFVAAMLGHSALVSDDRASPRGGRSLPERDNGSEKYREVALPKFRASKTIGAIAVTTFGVASSFAAPNATNAQLMNLLGDAPLSEPTDEPGPTRQMIECLQLLSGVDNDIFRGAPKELVGEIGVDCRRMIKTRTQDPRLNPMGFKVEDLENPQLARRILSAAQARDAHMRQGAAKRADDIRQQEADAERRAAEAREAREKRKQNEIHERAERLQNKVLGVWRGDLKCFGNMTALTLKLTHVNADGVVDGELEGASIPGRNNEFFITPPFGVTGTLASPQKASEGASSAISIHPNKKVPGPFHSFHVGFFGRIDLTKEEISGAPIGSGSCPLALKRAGGL